MRNLHRTRSTALLLSPLLIVGLLSQPASADPYADAVVPALTDINDESCLGDCLGDPLFTLGAPDFVPGQGGSLASLGSLGTLGLEFVDEFCIVDDDLSTPDIKVYEGGGVQFEDFAVDAGRVGEAMAGNPVFSIQPDPIDAPVRMLDLTGVIGGAGQVDRVQIIDIDPSEGEAPGFEIAAGADIDAVECFQSRVVLAKSDAKDTVNAGDNAVYTVTATNIGTVALNDVVITDSLPLELAFVSATPGAPICTHSGENIGGIVACNLGSLATEDSVDVVIEAQAGPTDVELTITNNALVFTSVVGATDTAAETTRIVANQADVSIEKIDDECEGDPICTPILAGDEVRYTVDVFNNGPGNATNVSFVDFLPADTVFVEATSVTPGVSCVYSAPVHQLMCNVGTIGAPIPPFGLVQSVRVDIVVRTTAPGVLENVAAIFSADQFDPNEGNNTASESTTIAISDVLVTDSVNASDDRLLDFDTLLVGDTAQGLLTVQNTGPNAIDIGPIVALPLADPFYVADLPPPQLPCFGTTLLPGASCSHVIGFSPTVAGDFADGFEFDFGDFSIPINVTGTAVPAEIDFSITKDVVGQDYDLETGDDVTFIVTVESGPNSQIPVDVVVKELIPRGLTISGTPIPDAGSYNPNSNEWSLASLGPGQVQTLSVPATVISTESECVTNRAVAEVTAPGLDTLTETARRKVSLNGCADLAVTDIVQTISNLQIASDLTAYSGPTLTNLHIFSGTETGCPDECVLAWGEILPDQRTVARVDFVVGPFVYVLGAQIRDGSSNAFSIWSAPTFPVGNSPRVGGLDGSIEIAFRSSEFGSEHQGVLDLITTDPEDPVISIPLTAQTAEDLGVVHWDVRYTNLGPGNLRDPMFVVVELPEGAELRVIQDTAPGPDPADEVSQQCELRFVRGRERWLCDFDYDPNPLGVCTGGTCAFRATAGVTGVFSGGFRAHLCADGSDMNLMNNGAQLREEQVILNTGDDYICTSVRDSFP